MMKICETNNSKVSSRHHLSSSFYSKRQNENISELVSILDAYMSFNPEAVQL